MTLDELIRKGIYEVVKRESLEDIGSNGTILRHVQTGARVVLLENEDENKVFYIGFRTPPSDCTGVAHITEHSVLCGSKEFPVKDPFVELVKGSLNTFLNAMTYPDKTVYPLASCNDQDFQNLMHVYLDGVFYPNIYKNPSIFRQEGWHYEFDEQDRLTVNGVVYNEMKGAYSTPDDILEKEILNSLYPDNCYGGDYGGDPVHIPELTYDAFLDFHRKYYHPSNSYIYLYGKMDMGEKLTFIHEQYLKDFDDAKVDSEIVRQKSFDHMHRIYREIPLSEGEDPAENTFLVLNYSLKDTLDPNMYLAYQVLDYVLCSIPGAPLKEALTKKEIGNDIYSLYENGICQPYFSIVAKDVSVSKEQAFVDTVYEELRRLANGGLDHQSVLAGINHFEFQFREADFGSYPKGLMYGLQILDSWLYSDEAPFIHMKALDTFRFLKEAVSNGYFEQLIVDGLLQNSHTSLIILEPKLGVLEKTEEDLRAKLDRYQAGLSGRELEQIRLDFEALTAFQEGEDAKEDLERIPLLSRQDLRKEAYPFSNIEMQDGDTPLLLHAYDTNGIAYLRYAFSMDQLPGDLYPYASLLRVVLGQIRTKQYSLAELNSAMNLATGGMVFSIDWYADALDSKNFSYQFEVRSKFLYEHVSEAAALVKEILFASAFDDMEKLREILAETKSQIQSSITASCHSVAARIAMANIAPESMISEILFGRPFYRFVSDLLEHFDEQGAEIVSKMREAAACIFRRENFHLDATMEEEKASYVFHEALSLRDNFYTCDVKKERFIPVVKKIKQGLISSGQVNYVCRAGQFAKGDIAYTGALRVLKVIMGYQYLWVNVRVKGGAYGCVSGFSRNGKAYFVSYRDPNLEKTIEVYEKAADAIAAFDADERTMTQFVIGTLSDMDVPLNPSAKGSRSYTAYRSHLSLEMVQRERNQVLNVTKEDIRALAAHLRAFMEDDDLVVIGTNAQISEQKHLFDLVENLFVSE